MIDHNRHRVGVGTRTVWVAVLALIAGFVSGIVLSEIIGIIGFLLFNRGVGIRYLSMLLAVVCAGVALCVEIGARRGSR